MTKNQRKAAFLKLLHHYILHTDNVHLCIFISELLNRKLLTKGEATFLRAMISAELNHRGELAFLDQVIPKIKVRYWFFFKRWETKRELRIRWIRSQIEKFNV
jgi:hypothetical protein